MCTILIGIDDTDNIHSRGTGHLARELSQECARRGLRPLGVTRHQFLVDPRIPYTSHNSGACVAVGSADGLRAVEFAFGFVAERAAAGSDPGVAVALAGEVPEAIMDFGGDAGRRVLTIDDAMRLSAAAAIELRGLGGTGDGVIGALGSVGQRAGGEQGRFIDLPGLRELRGRVDREALSRVGMSVVHEPLAHPAAPDDLYETFDWVRPRLVHGKPYWPVEWSECDYVWLPIDRKRSRARE